MIWMILTESIIYTARIFVNSSKFVFSMMKIVILDGYNTNPGDLDWGSIEALGDLSIHDRTPEQLIVAHAQDADVLIINKVVLNQKLLDQLPNVKLICLLATGYNNVDIHVAKQKGITVCNAPGYGVQGVAQHVFAMLLHTIHRINEYNEEVHQGTWSGKNDFSYWNKPIQDLSTKTLGIYGFGTIGSAVSAIGKAFGMSVIVHTRTPDESRGDVQYVDLETLLHSSDVLSLHAPLTNANFEIIDQKALLQMKSTSILINTARGGLINDHDLKVALEAQQISAACLDVLDKEPPPSNHILFGVKNCLITPHQAWASQKSRANIIDITSQNIKAFKAGVPINVVG